MNQKKLKHLLISLAYIILLFSVVANRSVFSYTGISFLDIDKNLDNTDNYEGIRLLQFFMPFCPGCAGEAAILEQINQNYNVTLFCLNVDRNDPKEILLEFKANHSLSDDWIFGYSTLETERIFDIDRVPTLVILDDLGNIVDRIKGSVEYSFIETRIQYALNHLTESYNTDFESGQNPLTIAIFIIIGTIVGVLVLYFLVMSFLRGRKDASLVSAIGRLKEDEMKKENQKT